jgi:7,8-dihydro-6-hydroxymethylpterin-pyrophosphokinase
VAIALGSNQGDRAELLRAAVRALPDVGVSVRTLSSLYETAPAYVTDQARATLSSAGAVALQLTRTRARLRATRSRRF